ncbi:hypothetical protein B1R94_02255 [Mycolicibacterium litorale]|nr:hypothetical protein B1R94_02255 [Mycolicibacterium litorale]
MSDYVVYRDSDGDDAQLEVSTGGPLGVVFTAESGPEAVAVGLDREAVERLHAQLGVWLERADGRVVLDREYSDEELRAAAQVDATRGAVFLGPDEYRSVPSDSCVKPDTSQVTHTEMCSVRGPGCRVSEQCSAAQAGMKSGIKPREDLQ